MAAAQPARVLGIDVGGTKTAFGVVRFPDGAIVAREEIKTPQDAASGAPFLKQVCAIARRMYGAAGVLTGIGLGLCELVDLDGEVSSAHRVHWQGLPVRRRLGEIAPALVESDVRAAALAETHWGAGRGARDLLYLNIGTGISSCFVKDGAPHAGAHGHALVIASSPMAATCADCGAESAYILEDVAGGAALAGLYGNGVGRKVESASEVVAAATQGEPRALALIAEAAKRLGVSVGLAINILDPDMLVVGGGLGGQDGPYWDAIVPAIRRQVWSEKVRTLPIRRAVLGPDAGVIGAAAARWRAA